MNKNIQIILFFLTIIGTLVFGEYKMNQARKEWKIEWEQKTDKEKCLWETKNTINTDKKMNIIITCNEIYD